MKRFGKSLYARIVTRMFLLLGFTGAVLLTGAWVYARLAADEAYDRVLVASALQIAENTWLRNGVVDVDLPVSAFSVLSERDRVYYAVIDPNGRIVAGDSSLQLAIPHQALRRGPVLRSDRFHDEPVRVALVGREMFDTRSRGWVTIALAVTEESRINLAESLTAKALLLIAVMGVTMIGGTMVAARMALKPVTDLAAELRGRDPELRTPLRTVAPAEVAPLVAAINQFIGRLDARVTLMRRIMGDVAHQIRTPITSAISQMELADLQSSEQERSRQMAKAKERLTALGALVQQLVNHAMVLHRAEQSLMEPLDVATLLRKEMTHLFSEPTARMLELDIEFDGGHGPMMVTGDAVMLREAFRNVLANALAYGARTKLTVTVSSRNGRILVHVIDDGAGIEPSRWSTVRQPFNPRPSDRGGASLGLSIFDEVMRSHGGTLSFSMDSDSRFNVLLALDRFGE